MSARLPLRLPLSAHLRLRSWRLVRLVSLLLLLLPLLILSPTLQLVCASSAPSAAHATPLPGVGLPPSPPPSSTPSASPSVGVAVTVEPSARRFSPQWRGGKFLPACTSELRGETHELISATQWPRLNFNPRLALTPESDCGTTGGTSGHELVTNHPACFAACLSGRYVNTSPNAMADGRGVFVCEEDDTLPGLDDPGLLRGGPRCHGPAATAMQQGERVPRAEVRSMHVVLEEPLQAEGTEALRINVSCPGHTLTPADAQFRIEVGQNKTSDVVTLHTDTNAGGRCTFFVAGGDARFVNWTHTVDFIGASIIASGIETGARLLTRSVAIFTLDVIPSVVGTLRIQPTCVDEAGGVVGSMDADGLLSWTGGQSSATLAYTLPGDPANVTCSFSIVHDSVGTFLTAPINNLTFVTERPTVDVAGIDPAQLLLTQSNAILRLTTSVAVEQGSIAFATTCTAGRLHHDDEDAATADGSGVIVIEVGSNTGAINFTAPAVKTDPITCSFVLEAGGDPRFAGVTIEPLVFSVDLPLAIDLDAAPIFAVGQVHSIRLRFSRAIAADGLELSATCSDGGSIPSPFTVAAEAASHVVLYTAPPSAPSEELQCTFERTAGDERYAGITGSLIRPALVFQGAVSGLLDGDELLGGSRTELTLRLSQSVYDDPLLVSPTCTDGDGDGEIAVGSFTPSAFLVPHDGSTASVNYTAPLRSIGRLVCRFAYGSGDTRFVSATGVLPLLVLRVVHPILSVTRLHNGSAVVIQQSVSLVLVVDPAPASDVVFRVLQLHDGAPVAEDRRRNVTLRNGTTSAVFESDPYPSPVALVSVTFQYESGDARFGALVSAPLLYSVALPSLSLGGLADGAEVHGGSAIRLTLTASSAVATEALLVNGSCDGVPRATFNFSVPVGQTNSIADVIAPAAASNGTTSIRCVLHYIGGDSRYTHASMPSLSFTVADALAGGSTADGGTRYLSDSAELGGGAVAGVVIGVLAAVAIMGAAGFFMYQRSRARNVTGATHVTAASGSGGASPIIGAYVTSSPSSGPAVSTLAVSAIVVQAAESPPRQQKQAPTLPTQAHTEQEPAQPAQEQENAHYAIEMPSVGPRIQGARANPLPPLIPPLRTLPSHNPP